MKCRLRPFKVSKIFPGKHTLGPRYKFVSVHFPNVPPPPPPTKNPGYAPVTYIHTFINSFIHTYIHSNIHSFIHTYIHTFIHTYITYIHSYIHTFIHTFIHTYIHTFIHTSHTYIHTYIHTYTLYTYTHIYIQTDIHDDCCILTDESRLNSIQSDLYARLCTFSVLVQICKLYCTLDRCDPEAQMANCRE